MRQYASIKHQYPDTLLLFQVGDFYELFFDDAKKAAAFLGIALTKRGHVHGAPIPLCGVPVHALDHYLTKLVKGGFKVALCDQLEQPVPGKVVERGVTRVLTPGTLTDAKLLEEKSASYLFSFFPLHDSWGLLFGELISAQLFATIIPAESQKLLESELSRFFPAEVLLPTTPETKRFQSYFKQMGYFTTLEQTDVQDAALTANVNAWLKNQFHVEVYQQLIAQESLRLALTTFYSYVSRNQRNALEQFKNIQLYKPDDFLILDSATQRNLELIKNFQDGGAKNTLFGHLDKAATAMGSRMLKKWLVRPLIKQEAIEQRLDVVATLVNDTPLRSQLEELLKTMGDVERVVGRIALQRAPLADYLALKQALAVLPVLRARLLSQQLLMLLRVILEHIPDFSSLYNLLESSLHDDATKEWVIKEHFDKQLDALRELANNSDRKILELEAKEQQASGNAALKIRYNQVQGYYIELTKLGAKSVPDYFIKQQTLVGKERFITTDLRLLQDEIMRAKQEVDLVEKQIFERVKQEVAQHVPALRKLAFGLAHLDALVALSSSAYDFGYVRPIFSAGRDIIIEDGRHPVVEATSNGGRFIPNSTELSDNASLWIITGPNMGGKSTYLRQVALICIMAQCGSFVPAKAAKLAILDRIFTRIGAGDNLAEGKSTFLVEMEETATICTQATAKSLVILDEVGRGTSTFDGLAIAQAVVEHIYTHIGARCLFATHYHELTHLQDRYPGIKSYYAASKKTPQGIIFLYKIMCGVADGSFGIEVAKLAQLPVPVLKRAQEILQELTLTEDVRMLPAQQTDSQAYAKQLQELTAELKHYKEKFLSLHEIDYDQLSPKQAFDILWKIKD